MSSRIQQALDAVVDAPRLLTEAGTGSLDPAKVGVVTGLLAGVSRKTKRAIERALLQQDIAGLTSTQLRRRIPKLLASLEPTAVAPAAKRRRRDQIGIFARPHHEPGLAEFVAILPTGDVAGAMRAVEDLAWQLHEDTTTDKTLAECRADAFIDLLLRNVGVDTTVVFHLPVRRLDECGDAADPAPSGARSSETPSTGDPISDELNALLDEMLGVTPVDAEFAPEDRTAGDRPRCEPPPCTWWWDEEDLPPFDPDELREGDIDWDHLLDEARAQHAATVGGGTAGETRPAPSAQRHRLEDVLVPGVGVIPAAEVAALTRAVGTKVTRALTDPATGTVIETMTGAYRPTGAIRRLVMARDEHCRFPGCTMPAGRCDVDHVVAWPDGPTAAHNLQSLCRHHHRAKHETDWNVSMTPDGVCTWISPSGRTYTTTPGD